MRVSVGQRPVVLSLGKGPHWVAVNLVLFFVRRKFLLTIRKKKYAWRYRFEIFSAKQKGFLGLNFWANQSPMILSHCWPEI
jgi:hypothetical protein